MYKTVTAASTPAETAEGEETGLAGAKAGTQDGHARQSAALRAAARAPCRSLARTRPGRARPSADATACICIRTDAPPKASRNETSTKSVFLGRNDPESAARPLVSSNRPDSSRSAGAREKTGSMSVSTAEKVTRKAVTSSETVAA